MFEAKQFFRSVKQPGSSPIGNVFSAMAAPDVNTAEGREEAIKMLDPDFQGLLERKSVPAMIQAQLAVNNVKSVSIFSVLGESSADVRTFAADRLGLDRARNIVDIASMVDSWEACKTRMSVRHQAEAEAQTAQLPPPMNRTEAQDLRLRFEQMFYRLEDKVSPSTGTLEQLSEQIDAGEFRTMALVQFMSRDDQDSEPLGATFGKDGTIKVKRGYGEVKPPKSGEELRQRLKLLGHSYMFMMLKYPNRPTLRDNNPNLWHKYSDYLLGEHVLALKAKNARGEIVATPSLELVLNYEYQVRKLMVRAMNEGKAINEALEDAMKDTTTKERYFLTPAALEAVSERDDKHKSRSPRRESWGGGGSSWGGGSTKANKGKGGKGKSKGKKGKGLKSHTPDGKPICFAWNNRDQRCRYACGREHCCQYCYGPHPAHSCKDTGGAGKDSGEKKE